MVQRVYGCPLIATFHSITAGAGGPTRNAEETYVAEMERWFAGRADRIAVLSDYARRELIRHYGIPVEKIDVIPGGAGTESFSTQVDREDFRSMFAERAERIVLFAGRLTPEKGPEVLLGSMEVLARHNPVRAVFAGDGPLRESLVAEAERRGLADRVRFTGHVGPSVLGALYQVSDVFVAPSRYECFGWGAMEAVLHGLPVVASSVGALSDLARILPSGTMNPVAPGDHQGLAVVISQVLKSNGLKKRNPDPVQGRLPESMGWEPLANRALDQIQSLIGLVRE
jgi:glycosyltransferase involved in cell wall biosynthesis